MRVALITLLAVLAFASPAFAATDVQVDNTAPTTAAGARTQYVVSFTLTNPVTSTGQMEVTFPAGTTFVGYLSSTRVIDTSNGNDVGSCASPAGGRIVCHVDPTITLPTGRRVSIPFRGVTNPTTPGNPTVSVQATGDQVPAVSPPLTVAPAGQLTAVSVNNAAPTRAADARTNYTVAFTLSGSGRLMGDANSEFFVTFPTGTTFAGMAGNPAVVDMTTNQDVGNCFNPSNLTIQCYVDAGASIPAGRQVEIRFRGITNTTTVATNHTVTVSTTSDPGAVPSAAFTTVTPGQVSAVTVDNATPTRVAGARTNYTVGFTLSGTGTLSGAANSQFSVTFPTGTAFAGMSGNPEVVDMTTNQDVGNCFGADGLGIQCYLDAAASIPGGRRVEVRFRGINNPTTVSTNHTVAVSTTSDPGDVPSAGFTTTVPGQVSAVTADNATPTLAAGGRTNYVVGFTLSAGGTLSGSANSRIDVTFPNTTTFAGMSGNPEVVDMTTNQDVGNCFGAVGFGIECYLDAAASIPGGRRVEIRFRGINNTGTVATNHTVTVSTTSDPGAIPSAAFTTTAALPVTTVTVDNATPTRAAGGRTNYTVAFTLSASGTLSGTANSRIDVTFPNTTTFAGMSGNPEVVDMTTNQDVGNCFGASGLGIQCYLDTAASIPGGRRVEIRFRGITNPTPVATNHTVTVSTTSDPGAIPSAAFTTTTPGAVSAVTVDNATPTRAAGGRTNYTVAFTLSASGTLSGSANSRIYVTFPTGTTFAGIAGNVEVVDTATNEELGNCFNPAGLGIECYLDGDKTIAGTHRVELRFRGVTNPTAVATTHTATVSTTSDPGAIASSAFTTTPRQALSAVTVGLSHAAAASNSLYVIGFKLSSSGTLSGSANSRIDITFPAGTTFASLSGSSTVNDTTTGQDVGNCFSPSGLVIQCYLDAPASIPSGRTVEIRFTGITNPTAAGEKQLTVVTTSDTVATGSYQVGPSAPLETTVLSGPAGPTSNATPTFTFSGNGLGFECSIDGAPFTACDSPYTTPAALAPGEHTFQVRSFSAAGSDPTPASFPFTVTVTPQQTPTPIPSATPTPTPTATPTQTPVPNKSVVGEPVSGTVLVCKSPGVGCTPLKAGQSIPVGSVIDTKKGRIELTAIPKAGAPPETAVFYDGIFKVAQKNGVTELALVEPLVACGKAKASAGKKVKKRRLWGDGKGAFRTVGKYSAATVRGTKWLVEDSCAGTLTKVTQGAVSVRDNITRKTIVVRAPKSYTARPKR